MSLKDFVPPVVTDLIRNNQRIVKYSSYSEALSHCAVDAYQNIELCNIISDKTFLHIETLKKKPFTLNPTTVYLAYALNYFVNAHGQKSISVLDFGGACGAHYFEVRRILPASISLEWTVVETEQMIRSANEKGITNSELKFVSRIEEVKSPVDFIHSSSALQYVPAPYHFLEKLVATRAQMILFNRMMFNQNDEDIITVQQSLLSSNGPGKLPAGYTDKTITYPHTTMSYRKMQAIMTSVGYECLSEFDEPSGSFKLGKEKILGKGLLFVVK